MKKKVGVFILGGGLVKESDGHWRTTNFEEGDNFGSSGDRLRVIAASYLAKEHPDWLLIASGGKGQSKDVPDAPDLSKVIKRELVELGVRPKRIIQEKNSGTTYQQLQELKRIIKDNDFKQVIILSNIYHLPRIEALIEIDKELKKMFTFSRIELKGAEDVLIEKDATTWQEIIKKAYTTEGMKKRIELERQGLKQIKEGTYQFREYDDI